MHNKKTNSAQCCTNTSPNSIGVNNANNANNIKNEKLPSGDKEDMGILRTRQSEPSNNAPLSIKEILNNRNRTNSPSYITPKKDTSGDSVRNSSNTVASNQQNSKQLKN